MSIEVKYRDRSGSFHKLLWIGAMASVCLLSSAENARCELILPGFSGPALSRSSVSEELTDLNLETLSLDTLSDHNSSSSRSTDSAKTDSPATAPDVDLFVLDAKHVGVSATGGMSGSHTHLDFTSLMAIASLDGYAPPAITLSGWLRANQFLFVPGAPRSGLLRPPRSTAETCLVQS